MRKMRKSFLCSTFLVVILAMAFCSVSLGSDMAFYAGCPNVDWYSIAVAQKDVEKMMNALKGLFKEIKAFDDKQLKDLEAWAKVNLKDNEFDIIWLPGTMPSVLYPNPNLKPDGSLAEEWLYNGNMFINVADWFAYCTYEGGARGADNAGQGAANILNVPASVIGSDDGAFMKMTTSGKKYIPSLKDFADNRCIHLSALKGSDWEVTTIFGSEGGSEDATKEERIDPVVLREKKSNGYLAIINQKSSTGESRADYMIDFVKNWVVEKIKLKPVELNGKLSAVWGNIKCQ
jgi:hypothetical protein